MTSWQAHQLVLGLSVMCAMVWVEFGLGLMPCTLCWLQQMIWISFMLTLLGVLIRPHRLWFWLRLLCMVLGFAVAARHCWLQLNHAISTGVCLPPAFSMGAQWLRLWQGSPSCHTLHWQYFGWSLPQWSLVGYCYGLCLLYGEFYNRDKGACAYNNHFTPD